MTRKEEEYETERTDWTGHDRRGEEREERGEEREERGEERRREKWRREEKIGEESRAEQRSVVEAVGTSGYKRIRIEVICLDLPSFSMSFFSST